MMKGERHKAKARLNAVFEKISRKFQQAFSEEKMVNVRAPASLAAYPGKTTFVMIQKALDMWEKIGYTHSQ